jgi:dihydroneopterin aldolase
MKYVLFLRDLAVPVRIGLHDFEKAGPQRLLISAALVVTLDEACADDPAAVYDYDGLRKFVLAIGESGHIALQETICAKIADYCQALPAVSGGWVRTAKPDVYPDAREVGCQMAWGDAEARALLTLASH